ncbi:MAG: YebC/PmpR family DNA-binding transcriptional regulator [Candidatus Riflebacteria bacterium]|nr:YebC/PmpR family DNA-binding transcriptional regulator [Candidatus Riflebacteria bacterium]
MSGHSKWSTIKHKKAAKDAKKGKIFTKLIRELTVAARQGGGDITMNARLRVIVDKAKTSGMPKDNIERAIKKGTGELEGESYEEVTYEGYGPGGVALLIDTLTDNKTRTVMEVRHTLSRNSGNLGSTGSTSFLFKLRGYFLFPKDSATEDLLMEKLLDKGVEDIQATEDGDFEVTCEPSSFDTVKVAADEAGLKYQEAEVTKLPTTTVKLTGEDAAKMLKLVEVLEDLDDVQNVHANFDISAADMAALEAAE